VKNRRRQRRNRRKVPQQQQEDKGPSLVNLLDGLLGVAVGLALLYWFFTGMIASCASWLPW
jgi:hypothetical protein